MLQVGSQTTSADQWWKARKAIADGMIGKHDHEPGIVPPQFARRRVELDDRSGRRAGGQGRQLHRLEDVAGPGAEAGVRRGPLLPVPQVLGLFGRHRDGPVLSTWWRRCNICWGEPQFPHAGGAATAASIVFKDSREVPDTFQLVADYAKGHSLVLSSSMANSQHIPGLIRGHAGTIVMVDHGMFEEPTDHITVIPETFRDRESKERTGLTPEYTQKFGVEPITIPVEEKDFMDAHVANFLDCVRSRQKPHLDVETGARAQVVINLAVQSYREGKTLYWDEKNWKATQKAPKEA